VSTSPVRGQIPRFIAVQARSIVRPALLVVVHTIALLGGCLSFAAESKAIDAPLRSAQPAANLAPTNSLSSTNPGVSAAKLGTNLLAAATTDRMESLDDKHLLAIGDRLSFRILEDEDDPRPLFVTDSGDLEVPYIGRFQATGKSCKQLAHELKAELEKEYYYHATVIVAVDAMTKSRGKVYLVGPVRAPGPQDIPSDEVLTLSKAILRAGGFSDFADKHNVKVTRKGAGGMDQKFTRDVAEILEKGRTDSDLPLESGDLIYVPERLVRF